MLLFASANDNGEDHRHWVGLLVNWMEFRTIVNPEEDLVSMETFIYKRWVWQPCSLPTLRISPGPI
jgi:hypothetical protein